MRLLFIFPKANCKRLDYRYIIIDFCRASTNGNNAIIPSAVHQILYTCLGRKEMCLGNRRWPRNPVRLSRDFPRSPWEHYEGNNRKPSIHSVRPRTTGNQPPSVFDGWTDISGIEKLIIIVIILNFEFLSTNPPRWPYKYYCILRAVRFIKTPSVEKTARGRYVPYGYNKILA